jgi:hypothetical protein
MKTFIITSGSYRYMGGLLDCISTGSKLVAANQARTAKVFKARAGSKKSAVIAEVTSDGIRWISDGRTVTTKKLVK